MADTVFVSGSSGFVAKHIVLQLLDSGRTVVGSLRDPSRAGEVRAALAPRLAEGALDRLRFVTLDMTRDAGWDTALRGCDAMIHTASPFPYAEPRTDAEVVTPAVDGTLRALRAARDAGIRRVVLTSSSYAVTKRALPEGRDHYTEEDWSDPEGPFTGAYARSKTLGERAAWAFVDSADGAIALAAVNPGLVVGPPLDRHFGTSISIIANILRGKFPMLPPYGGPVADVRDVAQMHLRALELPAAAGRRFLAAGGSLWVREMAEVLAAAHPDRRIRRPQGPAWLMRLIARLDPGLRALRPDFGRFERVSTEAARSVLGMTFAPPDEAIRATARYLVAEGLA